MNPLVWFIDTGFWLALVNDDDAYHDRAVALARSIRGPFLTTEAVVLELGDALARPRWRTTGITLIEQIRHDSNLEIVSVDRALSERAFNFYRSRPDQSWGLTDCVSFIVMQDRGITDALSADQHYVQAGFRAILRDL